MLFVCRGLKSFQEEFFDNTNDNIVAIFDQFLGANGLANAEKQDENGPNELKSNGSEKSGSASSMRRVNSATYHRGLTVLLDSNPDQYFITTDDFTGFKVIKIVKIFFK